MSDVDKIELIDPNIPEKTPPASIASTEDIIAELKAGRMVVLVDEEDRENEGDLVLASDFVTPAAINFMVTHARGLVCLCLTEARCDELGLPMMVGAGENGTQYGTNFTVSIEAREGVTTGISASDRARTIAVAANPQFGASEIVQPGHIFPLRARDGGVLVRAGHTEAGCDLTRLAGLTSASVICEIMRDDGHMARVPDLIEFAQKHQMKLITVKDMIAFAHSQGVPVLVDGAQSIPHMKVDVHDLDADFYVFSGHKVYGPTGIGVLYGKEAWLDKLPPYQGGGEMIQNVSFEKTTFNELPFKFEAGTPDYIGTTGLAKALDYVNGHGIEQIAAHEHELTTYALQRLKEIPHIRIFGEAAERGAVISFLVGDIHHFDLGTLLDRLGIAVRTGHHCAQPLMQRLGIEGTVRASFAMYNTKSEIDTLVAGIERVSKMF